MALSARVLDFLETHSKERNHSAHNLKQNRSEYRYFFIYFNFPFRNVELSPFEISMLHLAWLITSRSGIHLSVKVLCEAAFQSQDHLRIPTLFSFGSHFPETPPQLSYTLSPSKSLSDYFTSRLQGHPQATKTLHCLLCIYFTRDIDMASEDEEPLYKKLRTYG